MENLRSLVLNSSYEPLQFTSARRALVLSMLGKAEVVEADGFFIHTATTSFRLPTVIRLNRYVKRPYKSYISFSKRNVIRRDNHTCQYCGVKGVDMTIDHVIPRSKNGESTWENVVTACRRCNLNKGSRALAETGMKLIRRPVKPKFLLFANTPRNAPPSHIESWARYMPQLRTRD